MPIDSIPPIVIKDGLNGTIYVEMIANGGDLDKLSQAFNSLAHEGSPANGLWATLVKGRICIRTGGTNKSLEDIDELLKDAYHFCFNKKKSPPSSSSRLYAEDGGRSVYIDCGYKGIDRVIEHFNTSVSGSPISGPWAVRNNGGVTIHLGTTQILEQTLEEQFIEVLSGYVK